ncbi:hypothetical protein [Lentzea jiangxiensis]|uniref:hypothetical protein n=1 Tax=Lentzea jiangxiensis TaxID=641025 RepID=UPI00115FADB7|nr:hypothetical protein [Lentzea jiangxiensis]
MHSGPSCAERPRPHPHFSQNVIFSHAQSQRILSHQESFSISTRISARSRIGDGKPYGHQAFDQPERDHGESSVKPITRAFDEYPFGAPIKPFIEEVAPWAGSNRCSPSCFSTVG